MTTETMTMWLQIAAITNLLVALYGLHQPKPRSRNEEGDGKPCPKCGSAMIGLRSTDERLCSSCGHVEPWNLRDDQAPLLGPKVPARKLKESGK